MSNPNLNNSDIAIIGISGRFPGAKNIEELWQNLINGKESILFNQNKDNINDPNFVNASALLNDTFNFDSQFFNFSNDEACKTDPHSRLALTCAWEAFEDAGYNPTENNDSVGVFIGAAASYYLLNNILPTIKDNKIIYQHNEYFYNCSDYISTIISYKLNLKGPSLTLHSFCSSSSSAIHYSCRSILDNECKMALAGGVHVTLPENTGYFYRKSDIYSKDGHCRVFDAEKHGTLFGNGVGIILLKRLNEAINDGDHIYAVIKGSYINNDGAKKLSYFTPSKEGQVNLINGNLERSNVKPEEITYIEAHGTGTIMGDRIEVKALHDVFNGTTSDNNGEKYYVGSVKPNISHLGSAAGIASIIKVALALQKKVIPPTININTLRPDLEKSDVLQINTHAVEWTTTKTPRKAIVNSFGFGGTNVSVLMEEPPLQEYQNNECRSNIILISGIRKDDVNRLFDQYKKFLASNDVNMEDLSYTTIVGRKHFAYRMFFIASNKASDPFKYVSETEYFETTDTLDTPSDIVDFERDTTSTYENYLKTLGNLWLKGANTNWKSIWTQGKRKRISAPTYPFKYERFELNANNIASKVEREEMDNWFYRPIWKNCNVDQDEIVLKNKTWIVFIDNVGIGAEIIREIKDSERIIEVYKGKVYNRHSDIIFTIDPKSNEHFGMLFKDLKDLSIFPDKIIYLWTFNNDLNAVNIQISKDIYFTLLKLFREIGEYFLTFKVQFYIITKKLHNISGLEGTDYKASVINSFVTVLKQEYKNFYCKNIDIEESGKGFINRRQTKQIVRELVIDDNSHFISLRGNNRWIKEYEKVSLKSHSVSKIQKNGVYLITGGLGNIGVSLCKYLLKEYNAKLIITTRINIDVYNNHSDKKLSSYRRIVDQLKELGEIFLITTPDIYDENVFQQQILDAEKNLGIINGVFHLAGVLNDQIFKGIDKISVEACEKLFNSKLESISYISNIFSNKELDFCVLFSSISSVLGGIGHVAYCAVNNYLDYYVQDVNTFSKNRWVSINWDSWETSVSIQNTYLKKHYILPEEGIKVIEKILSNENFDQIIVSTGNLYERIDKWMNHNIENFNHPRFEKLLNVLENANKQEKGLLNC